MQYVKPALTFEEQADLLIQRGMAGDRDLIIQRLSCVNYYRLSGYWYPFRNLDDTFKAGTSFNEVWYRYVFDRQFRLLAIDAIERIEIAVRTTLAYQHGHARGPFGYVSDPGALPGLSASKRSDFLLHVEDEANRSKEQFVDHFWATYGDCHSHLPVWEATEIMAFGTLLTFFLGSPRQVKLAVSSKFGVPDTVFGSWLLTLNSVRNICAHHGRLWNRVLGVKPFIPRWPQYPDWHVPVTIENGRMFGVLTILRHCLKAVAPQSGWPDRFAALLGRFPSVPLGEMGFPCDWRSSPLWK